MHGKAIFECAWVDNNDHMRGMQTPLKVVDDLPKIGGDSSVQPINQSFQMSAIKHSGVVKGGWFMVASKQALKLKKVSPLKGHTKKGRLTSLNTSLVQQHSATVH